MAPFMLHAALLRVSLIHPPCKRHLVRIIGILLVYDRKLYIRNNFVNDKIKIFNIFC